ncbi:MAG: EamA family transporter, partial [Silvibacterium sp.]
MSRSVKAHLLLLGVVFVWGSTFVLVKDALADVSPLLFNLMRMALAALCLGVLYRRHIGHVDRGALLSGAVAGLFLATGYQF